MRILYVWDSEYPWDVRTEKVCAALVAAGHQVVITAGNRRGDARRETRPEGLVERLASGPLLGKLSFPAFFNPLWVDLLYRMVRRHEIELVIVRDLPLAPTALFAAPRSVPVILDMAENYPAMIRDIWTDRRQRPLDFLVRNPSIVAATERFVLRRVAHTLVVVEESGDRLMALGVPAERITLVSNTPPRGRIEPLRPRNPLDRLRIVYLGLMEEHRGIGCTLDAVEHLLRDGTRFHLDLIGDGRDLARFRARAAALGLGDADITFHGRLAHREAIALVGRAHIGLVPHEARESWNTTIPNKLFDYMAAGLGVVTSDAIPAARVVRTTGCGAIFGSGDGAQLAQAIRQCADLATWDRCRRAGQNAIRETYNWESDSDRLLECVAKFGGRRGS